jgi:hypothetical protein
MAEAEEAAPAVAHVESLWTGWSRNERCDWLRGVIETVEVTKREAPENVPAVHRVRVGYRGLESLEATESPLASACNRWA